MSFPRFSFARSLSSSLALALVLTLTACLTENAEPSAEQPADSAEADTSLAPPTVLADDPVQWRDLGGYQLALTNGNGPIPATGWRTAACAQTYVINTTYLPGMVRSGTFLVFKLDRVSQANFERFWALTAGAPPISPDTAILIGRLPFFNNHQTAVVSVGDNLVNGVVTVGGFTNRCSQRTSATAPFRIGYSFNATPGGGTASVGDGRPYITEICDERDFAFIEIFVP
jgi:hypothetical protein